MFGKYFYNESMRRMTVAFGQLFNKIQVKRTDSSGNTVQTLAVPLAYAPKEKFLTRLDQQPNLEEREFAITLPRMSFEISGISYDGARKLTRIQKYKTVKTDKEGKVMNYNYTPVPYNISYTLNIFTATAESGLQIVEQILPFFQPDYTVTVIAVPELDIKRDVPIILNDVQYDDSYNGDFTSRRAVIYTLNFTAKTYLFGPATTQKTIKEVQSDLYTDTPEATREERIVITPNPTSADANDDFGFTTTITTFSDGKNYNPITDQDE
ncbi:tail sheath stabilizer and completion protein [Amylibacter sp.]|nr:tail sheath stabilizer and completion protein [Amylibacter sp.]